MLKFLDEKLIQCQPKSRNNYIVLQGEKCEKLLNSNAIIVENVYQIFTVPGSVDADELEGFPLDLVVEEDGPVEEREQEVDRQVNQNVNPDQLEDAALPDQHQTPEPAVHRTAGLRVPVGVDVFAGKLSTL